LAMPRATRFRKGVLAGLASVALPSSLRVTKLDQVVLMVCLHFPVVSTIWIWTEIAYVYQFRHWQLLSLGRWALPNSTNTQEGDYRILGLCFILDLCLRQF
jgi:hypothetical protein